MYISDEMSGIIGDVESETDEWGEDMVGKYWVMTTDGLRQTSAIKTGIVK